MRVSADYVVVGAGPTGASAARTLADAGRDVVVVDRRPRVGGNCADAVHEPSGVRYHLYGPHYFRTNSDRVWEFVTRFADFYPWAARVQTSIGGRLYRWPLRAADAGLRPVAVDGYNLKMWGTDGPPGEAAARVGVLTRDDADDRLKADKYQGLPRGGYSAWIGKMLEGVPAVLGGAAVTAADVKGWVDRGSVVVFTGPLDELYGYEHGRLPYRGMRRWLEHRPECGAPRQAVPQVNRPEPLVDHVRSVEWNHLAEVPSWRGGSLTTREYPADPGGDAEVGREYPVGRPAALELYKTYRARADATPALTVCGRLGNYRYMDMDEAVAQGIAVGRRLLEDRP